MKLKINGYEIEGEAKEITSLISELKNQPDTTKPIKQALIEPTTAKEPKTCDNCNRPLGLNKRRFCSNPCGIKFNNRKRYFSKKKPDKKSKKQVIRKNWSQEARDFLSERMRWINNRATQLRKTYQYDYAKSKVMASAEWQDKNSNKSKKRLQQNNDLRVSASSMINLLDGLVKGEYSKITDKDVSSVNPDQDFKDFVGWAVLRSKSILESLNITTGKFVYKTGEGLIYEK